MAYGMRGRKRGEGERGGFYFFFFFYVTYRETNTRNRVPCFAAAFAFLPFFVDSACCSSVISSGKGADAGDVDVQPLFRVSETGWPTGCRKLS